VDFATFANIPDVADRHSDSPGTEAHRADSALEIDQQTERVVESGILRLGY
jgi:hypothetical protein